MSLNVVFCAPVEIVFSRQRIVSRRGFRLPQFDELFRMDVGQRLEQRGVNGGENRRVRADAEGEGKHGDGGEAGGFAQHAQTVAQILYEVLSPVYFARVAAFLFGLLGPAQVESRAARRRASSCVVPLRRIPRFFVPGGRATRRPVPGLPAPSETTTAAAVESCTANAPLAFAWPPYSYLKATIGSTRMARRAGTQEAASTTLMSSEAANPYVRLSVRETP
jgi:hypothetical protein